MHSIFRALSLALFAWVAAAGGASARVAILADGSDGNSARIAIRSAITKGDLAAFRAAMDSVSRTAANRIMGVPFVTVELNSPGGDVVEAVGIGRVIYEHSAFTMVRQGQECVSACVFIYIAGAVRTPQNSAAIGVHKPLLVAWYHMDSAQAHAKYDGLMDYLRGYFRDLGVSNTAYEIMMHTDSADMHYFTAVDLDRLGLTGASPEWMRRYAAATPAAADAASAGAPNYGDAPKLPEIDESYRYVVFMPGDSTIGNYLAGLHIIPPHLVWTSFSEGRHYLDWSAAPEIDALLRAAYDAIWPVIGPNLWLLALLLFEILRGRAPDGRRAGHARDQWRLAPFRRESLIQSDRTL
jgi:hypothetical protein